MPADLGPPDTDFRDSLAELLGGRVVIVGVGNRQRGDDGAGPCVVDHRHPTAGGLWLDAGVTPENFLEPIVRAGPQLVLIVDAVAFGGLPGACRLLETADLDTGAISTHAGSLQLVHRYLEARSPAGVKVLGIQPERIEPGEGLSPAVAEAVRRVAATLSDLLA